MNKIDFQEKTPKKIYNFYMHKLITKISNLNLSKHAQFLVDFDLKIGIFDFCGRLKFYGKYFLDFSVDCWIVENDWENDISDILHKYDLVYFFDDVEFVNENIFYNSYTNKNNFIFVLFSGGRFNSLETFLPN